MKSDVKMPSVPAFVAVATGSTVGVAANGDQKWEITPRRKPSGISAYPPKLNWWVRSREPGPIRLKGLRLLRPVDRKSASPPATVVPEPIDPALTYRDSVYVAWKLRYLTPVNGCWTFCTSFRSMPL